MSKIEWIDCCKSKLVFSSINSSLFVQINKTCIRIFKIFEAENSFVAQIFSYCFFIEQEGTTITKLYRKYFTWSPLSPILLQNVLCFAWPNKWIIIIIIITLISFFQHPQHDYTIVIHSHQFKRSRKPKRDMCT